MDTVKVNLAAMNEKLNEKLKGVGEQLDRNQENIKRQNRSDRKSRTGSRTTQQAGRMQSSARSGQCRNEEKFKRNYETTGKNDTTNIA
jgi:hypothetical protein